MENSTSLVPDWANLPLAVVYLISEKVKSITDYVRFRAVCSPWRLASLPKPRHLPYQLLWMIIPYSDRIEDDGIRLFYNLWQSKMHKIHLQETIGKTCCASYRGWLLLVAPKGTELFLLNPVTRACVQLPPFTTPVRHISDQAVIPPRKVNFLFNSIMGNMVITKITFSADLSDPNCIIMVFFRSSRGIFFCQVGDCCWTEVFLDLWLSPGMVDAAYNKGRFYLLHKGTISIYDRNPNKVQTIYLFEPELRPELMFFWKGTLGSVLLLSITLKKVRNRRVVGRLISKNMSCTRSKSSEWRLNGLLTQATLLFSMENTSTTWLSVLMTGTHLVGIVCTTCLHHMLGLGIMKGKFCYNIYFVKLDGGSHKLVVLDLAHNPQLSSLAMWFQPSFV